MAIKDWEVGMKAPIEKLEELLFDPDVQKVAIVGDSDLAFTTDYGVEVIPGTTFPEEIMRDFANELLLPNIDFKGQRKLAAEHSVGDKVNEGTIEVLAALKLRSPFHSGRSVYVRMESHWALSAKSSEVTLTKY